MLRYLIRLVLFYLFYQRDEVLDVSLGCAESNLLPFFRKTLQKRDPFPMIEIAHSHARKKNGSHEQVWKVLWIL